MSRFKVTEEVIGEKRAIRISDEYFSSSLDIAQTGATVLAFRVKVGEELWNIIDGYSSREQLLTGTGAKCTIMAPFSNKIRNNRYTFNGHEYSLGDSASPVYHGLVWNRDFEVSNIHITEELAEVTLSYFDISGIGNPGYPFQVDTSVIYTLSGNVLRVAITGKNNGGFPAPFTTGWHPYFLFPGKQIDTYLISIPAEKVIATDSDLFPFPGAMAYSNITNLPVSDFRPVVYPRKRVLGRRVINNCYSNLPAEKDGFLHCRIEQPEFRHSINLKQERGVVYCFTGEEHPDRPRRSIALEPVENITDAFNRDECRDKITLAPGAEKRFVAEVEFQ